MFLLFCIAFILLNTDRVPRIGTGRFTDYLGKLSLTYYLAHGIILFECARHLPMTGIGATLLILGQIFVLANLILFTADGIHRCFTKRKGTETASEEA